MSILKNTPSKQSEFERREPGGFIVFYRGNDETKPRSHFKEVMSSTAWVRERFHMDMWVWLGKQVYLEPNEILQYDNGYMKMSE